MKKFMALYEGSMSKKEAWDNLSPAERKAKEQAGMAAWGAWMEEHKDSIVDMGGPLGKTKRTSNSGVADTRNEIGAYVVVQAESHEEAAKMFEGHPHFTIFPGEWVETMEVMAMPSEHK